MLNFNQQLAELPDLLGRADVLRRWTRGLTIPVKGGTRIELQAELAIRNDAHARPPSTNFDRAKLELQLVVCGNTLNDIKACDAHVIIDGLAPDGSTLRRFAMHFDRHPPNQQGTDLHLTFHWQLGGDRFDDLELGNMLLLQSPRFPSHPMDPILLVDFVLGHFHGGKRSQLMKPDFIRYRRLLHASQTHFVAPFFEELHLALTSKPDNLEKAKLWPALCSPSCPRTE